MSQPQEDNKAHRHILKTAKPFRGLLYPVIQQGGMIEMPQKRRGSLIQVLARAIVGQQVAAKVAATFWRRLEEAVGTQKLEEFLSPKNATKIRRCGVSNNKVRFLIGLGKAKRDGVLSARRVNAMDHAARIDYLSAFDGIGVWTCDIVGIFYCHDPDIWPQGDLAVRRTFSGLTNTDEKLTAEKTEIFSPFRSYLAMHMWREKNNPLIKN